MQKTNESSEALMRIVVAVISGIVLNLWKVLITFLSVVNFVITLFTGKRNKEIADFCEIWNTQFYIFVRYMIFVSNDRPFPFNSMDPNLSKFKA